RAYVKVAGFAGGEVFGVQLIADAAEIADALEPVVERGLDLVDRSAELALVRGRLLDLAQFLVDDAADLLDRRARPRGDDDLVFRVERLRRLDGGDVLRDLQVVDEALVEPRVHAAGEQQRQHVELGVSGRELRRRRPGQIQPRQLHVIL